MDVRTDVQMDGFRSDESMNRTDATPHMRACWILRFCTRYGSQVVATEKLADLQSDHVFWSLVFVMFVLLQPPNFLAVSQTFVAPPELTPFQIKLLRSASNSPILPPKLRE